VPFPHRKIVREGIKVTPFLQPKSLVARKSHCCYECGQEIEIGERYERFTGIEDGAWSHARYHLSCVYATQYKKLEAASAHEERDAILAMLDDLEMEETDDVSVSIICKIRELIRERLIKQVQKEMWGDRA